MLNWLARSAFLVPRVTQVLHLLELDPDIADAAAALGDPLPRPIISERMLGPLLDLPHGEQWRALQDLIAHSTRNQGQPPPRLGRA